MSPSSPDLRDAADESDEAATTRHARPALATILEESMDETSATRHESAILQGPDAEDLKAVEAEAAEERRRRDGAEEQRRTQQEHPAEDDGDATTTTASPARRGKQRDDVDDVSSRLHRKVAEIAAKAYQKASEHSQVFAKTRVEDVALMKIEELDIGRFLGKGSFSHVHEINRIACAGIDASVEVTDDHREQTTVADASSTSPPAPKSHRGRQTVQVDGDPRKLLATHYRHASGTCRYAVKFLKEEVRSDPKKFAIGTADLVVEGMFLASLSHPNIVKVRGLPEGGVQSLVRGNRTHGYFLIMDRLFDTLAVRVYQGWKGTHKIVVKKRMMGFKKDKNDVEERDADLAERLKVAFDISAALKFLHSKNIIYRDLKPENLGFDVRGDIKLFDLGLVKELFPNERDKNGNYRLSMAGTPRYMAPECGLYQPYNLSADVYSFSMLFWEMLTLEKPLKDFTYSRLKDEIFVCGDRPPLKKVFNKKMRALVASGWHHDPRKRPSIDDVYDRVKAEYLRLSPEKPPEAEIRHDRRRSTFVMRGRATTSLRNLVRLESNVEDALDDAGLANNNKPSSGQH
ncbi:hypothetical protein ACHAWF_015497 [Thalassiosira exigua]